VKRRKTSRVKRELGDPFPTELAPEEKTWVNTGGTDSAAPMQLNFNQQINFFGEIQGFDNLDKLSPDVKSAAIQYLEREQSARLNYVTNEQRNSHVLQQKGQLFSAKIQSQSMLLACALFAFSLAVAAYLLTQGQKSAAIALILGEIAIAVCAVVYGQRVDKRKRTSEPDGNQADDSDK
jgi:hypothetical protein